MAIIPNFRGSQIPRSTDPLKEQAYKEASHVYSSSSFETEQYMNPALVVCPRDDHDIVAAIRHARNNGLAIGIKSGGHFWMGGCSTKGDNILMDLSNTFRNSQKDLVVRSTSGNRTRVYASVSHNLGELNGFLGGQGLFVPHGRCHSVHVGGHAQTGGYGELARSFGLFGDHITAIRMYDHSANVKEVTRESDPELFFAILGGSPGNFGVITHYTIETYHDNDYVFGNTTPHALWGVFRYDPAVLQNLICKVAEMADDPSFDRNYDLSVNVLGATYQLSKLGAWEYLASESLQQVPESDEVDCLGFPLFEPVIVVNAQWVPFSANDAYNSDWFHQISSQAGKIRVREFDMPMSVISGMWLHKDDREFDLPYVKRVHMTNSSTLGQNQWAEKMTQRLDMAVNPKHQGARDQDLYKSCYLFVQISALGGAYNTNADNGTSFSWRDSTVCQAIGCFYEEGHKEAAEKWQAQNDLIMNGPDGAFSSQDRRVLWGAFGDWSMKDSWQYYHEDRAKYERIGRARARADPEGTFSPNSFAVERVA